MSDERQMLFLESIQRQLFEMDEKMTAYMDAKLHLELCETKKEKLIYIKAAMEKIDKV